MFERKQIFIARRKKRNKLLNVFAKRWATTKSSRTQFFIINPWVIVFKIYFVIFQSKEIVKQFWA